MERFQWQVTGFFLKIDFSHENKTFKTWGNSLQLPYAYGQKFHPMWSKLP